MERLTKTHTYTLGGLNGTQTQVSDYMIKKLGYLERDDIRQDVVDKLGKLEDLMELYHCNSIDDLKTMLENWDKLKEFITGLYAKAEYGGVEHCVTSYILEKMAKLEPKGDE